MAQWIGPALLAFFAACGGSTEEGNEGCVGCVNPGTPAGHEGYLYHVPSVYGSREFLGTQEGPSSPGLVWQQFVVNIDMRSKTYSESFEILTADRVNLKFQAHAKISLRKGSVKSVIEDYGGSNWYLRTVKEQYRTAVREAVRPHKAFEVPELSQRIGDEVLARMRKEYADAPMAFESISIGNMDYPAEVEEEIQKVLAAQQREKRVAIEERIAKNEARVRIAKAEGVAKATHIVNQSLSPLYIQHEAIEAYHKLAQSRNTTFVIIPTSPDGAGMPLILNADNSNRVGTINR